MPCFDDNSKNHQQFLRLKTPTVSKSRHNTKLVAPLKGGSSETINKSRNCVLVWREIESLSVFQSLMIEENVISSDTKKLKTNKQTKKKEKKTKNLLLWGSGANNRNSTLFCDARLIGPFKNERIALIRLYLYGNYILGKIDQSTDCKHSPIYLPRPSLYLFLSLETENMSYSA